LRPLPPLALAALERRRKEQSAEMLRAPKLEVGRSMSEHDHFHCQGDDLRPGQNGFVSTSEIGTILDPRKFDRWFAEQRTQCCS
jgi:hypothetical protein